MEYQTKLRNFTFTLTTLIAYQGEKQMANESRSKDLAARPPRSLDKSMCLKILQRQLLASFSNRISR